MKRMKLTREEASDFQSLLAEGFHTAFRKGLDSPRAHPIWKAIKDLPNDEWGQVLDFVMDGIQPYLEQHLIPAVGQCLGSPEWCRLKAVQR